jgi:putative protease
LPLTGEKIELLAPAQNMHCGLAAIEHGADAVYIGGPSFGARAAATNSLADIEQLVRHAHRFHAKVYVTLNTLLHDDELDQAVALCHQLYALGADALIIQDVGLLESDLPPIALHSSTQMNNRTPEKVRFLEQVGFAQVVLARELSLAQIRAIRAATSVPLEFFVHGALCVAYSGQCYISEVVADRSANRGRCAQFCRHTYDLLDAHGQVLQKDRYLLSLKDLDLSAHLEPLIDAGIRSFKIEGRLKDANYVKNVTAAYRMALDRILEARGDLRRASSGQCQFTFTPDPARSFSRGATDYFLTKQRNAAAEIRSPKSIGKHIGRVVALNDRSFTLSGEEPVHSGDGLCFFDRNGVLVGMRVNRVDGHTVFPKDGVAGLHLFRGADIFRNFDAAFNRALENSTQCRTMGVRLTLTETADGLQLDVVDEDGIASTTTIRVKKEQASKLGTTESMALRQLKKSGGTIFSVEAVTLHLSADLFFPAAVVNDLRRRAFALHQEQRIRAHVRETRDRSANTVPWIATEVDYRDNITNQRALAFYRRHGVQQVDTTRLRAGDTPDCVLMTTRYCIKAQLDLCRRQKKGPAALAEPLILADRTGQYALSFDCTRCEMTVRKKKG